MTGRLARFPTVGLQGIERFGCDPVLTQCQSPCSHWTFAGEGEVQGLVLCGSPVMLYAYALALKLITGSLPIWRWIGP